MNILKLCGSIVLLVLTVGCNAGEPYEKHKSYPWGNRVTYMDGVQVQPSKLARCSFYYRVRNKGIISVHSSKNFISYWIAGRLRREEADSFITVFCGFTKIRGNKPPKILGKATFSSPSAASEYLSKHKK